MVITESRTEKTRQTVRETGLKHIAIIMDGNRRWAKKKYLPSAVGHQKGVDALKTAVKACHEFGVKYLTVYAFSTENWRRTEEEVNFLMGLLAKTIKNELAELHANHVRIKFIGDISPLNEDLKNILINAEEVTKDNDGVQLQIAFNYGARAEVVHAVKKIAKEVKEGKISIDEITEDTISSGLYTAEIPDPDLLIRTGGEKRISNYLLWQLAYSELYITDTFWPDFDYETLSEAIEEFHNRSRRFGK
ncbi:isoprenyl transferase [bacterium]|nr:isoprenyl transferase [bacterium]